MPKAIIPAASNETVLGSGTETLVKPAVWANTGAEATIRSMHIRLRFIILTSCQLLVCAVKQLTFAGLKASGGPGFDSSLKTDR
jgi:hypothetical protein